MQRAGASTRAKMEEDGDFSKKAKVSRQRLLKIQGFLNYVVRNLVTPYMKGLQNMIDVW